MAFIRLIISFLVFGLMMTACSGTKTDFSWSNEDFKGRIENIYIIGIAKNDFRRMYFENTFHEKLKNVGVKSIPSSTDLTKNEVVALDLIAQKMEANNCDAVLLTRVTNIRTTVTMNQGSYRFVPRSSIGSLWTYERPPYYNSWDVYYNNAYQIPYVPTETPTLIVKLTVESVLYDLKTEELIWTALMETDLEKKFDEMIQKFVVEAIKDLKEGGLI